MIIDSHTHIGQIDDFHLSGSLLIESLKKYKIDFAIVSNIEGAEFGPPHKMIKRRISQIELNTRILNLVKQNPNMLRALFWIKPNTENFSNEIEKFICNNRKYIVGIKAHPSLSELAMTDEKYRPYLELGNRLKIPFEVHTSDDQYSRPVFLQKIAEKYNNINFIMVHMGLGTNCKEAINLIKDFPNLYGDTTWVPIGTILEAVEKCGSRKILFGTDSPVNGIDTYKKYLNTISAIRNKLTQEDADNILYKNAKRLFLL